MANKETSHTTAPLRTVAKVISQGTPFKSCYGDFKDIGENVLL